MQKKRCVLVAGHSLCDDPVLENALQEIADVVKSSANHQIETLMATRPVDLVLLEISPAYLADVELIKHLKQHFPNTVIIVVDGDADREVIARAFSSGAQDVFRKPYNGVLLVERVNALLQRMA